MSTPPQAPPPAGPTPADWYPDPENPGQLRYWDGSQWTEHRHPAQPQGAGDGGDHRLITVGADAHFHALAEIDSLDALQKTVHEMLPRLFAVTDDIKAGILLQLDRQQSGIALGIFEVCAFEPPWSPQLIRLRQPGWFRQTSGNGR